jgi:hypothetical protein
MTILRLVILRLAHYSNVFSASTQIKIALTVMERGILGILKALQVDDVFSAFLMNGGMAYSVC